MIGSGHTALTGYFLQVEVALSAHDYDGFHADFYAWLGAVQHVPSASYQLLVAPKPGTPGGDPPFDKLKAYFESAHADARQHFHAVCMLDLHPRASGPTGVVEYPNRLVGNVRRGLFGEALCGVVAQTWLLLTDQRQYLVPVFLFREHSGVEDALNKLLDGQEPTDLPGRLGDDFLAVQTDDSGNVVSILVGEAKFRSKMNPSIYKELMLEPKGVLPKMSAEGDAPSSITKLIRILREIDPERFETIRASLEEIHYRTRLAERVDLVVLAYEEHGATTAPPYSPTTEKPKAHDSTRPLVIAELHIPMANDLMDKLYTNLYR